MRWFHWTRFGKSCLRACSDYICGLLRDWLRAGRTRLVLAKTSQCCYLYFHPSRLGFFWRLRQCSKKEGGDTQELFQAFREVTEPTPGWEWEGTTKLQGKGCGKERPLIWATDAISLPQGGCIHRLIVLLLYVDLLYVLHRLVNTTGTGNGKSPHLRALFSLWGKRD